jgi:hypothetical protein
VLGFSSLAKLFVTVVLAATSGPVGVGARPADPVPFGTWGAGGKVGVAWAVSSERAGETLERAWHFATTCRDGGCSTVFLRTSAAGVQRAKLVRHHGYYTANFGPIALPCEHFRGRPGRFTAHFRLWWSTDGSQLLAFERARYGGKCDPGWSETKWRAARVSPRGTTQVAWRRSLRRPGVRTSSMGLKALLGTT